MKDYSGLKNSKNIKSQIAIIITFVIAVIVLMVIVFVNIAKVSNIKTGTARTVDAAALRVASNLGSMSHYFKEEILEGEESQCDWSIWVKLSALVGATLLLFNFPVPTAMSMVLLSVAFTPSKAVQKGIKEKFLEMSAYNAVREEALYTAIASLHADDVLAVSTGGGIFKEDVNGDGNPDAGGNEFDLSGIDEVRNSPFVDRFSAWYYAKRLPLVADEGLKTEMNVFLDKLREYIDLRDWNEDKWIFDEASFTVEPINPGDIDVTCVSPDCPPWVIDAEANRISVSLIKESARNEEGNYDPFGFLEEKFHSLAQRLEDDYGLSFCSYDWWCPAWIPWVCTSNCSEIKAVISHLTEFVARTKEILETPETIKVQSVSEWFGELFYDAEWEHRRDGGDHDIYERLTLINYHIGNWLTELDTLNSGIIDEVEEKHGQCSWGRGSAISSSCYEDYGESCDECGCTCCCCDDCTGACCCCNTCCWPSSYESPCAWEGTYYTCCKEPPVCSDGDLYGVIPGWCASHEARVDCDSNCSCTVDNSDFSCEGDADNFQGDLAHDNTDGYTEVGQAIGILQALQSDITEILDAISEFADELKVLLDKDDPLRNELVYAWKGKDDKDGKDGRQHLVRAAIGNYPLEFPSISEEKNYFDLQKCFVLNNARNEDNPFTFTTSRYSEDMTPAVGWTMRYRKKTDGDDYNKLQLTAIVREVLNDGAITGTRTLLTSLINSYAIRSAVEGYYGPDEQDIYIEKITPTALE